MNSLAYPAFLFVLLMLPLASCAQLNEETAQANTVEVDTSDRSCSYFYFLWGTHAEYNNQFAEALDAYEKALVCDPGAAYVRQKLPLLLLKSGKTEQAVALLLEAIERNPQDIIQRALLARIHIQQKNEQKAIDQYRTILDYEPENEQVLLRLGILQSQAGDLAAGRATLEKLVDINDQAYFARLYLARIADQLDDPQEAEAQYRQALELNWSAELSYEIAEFYLKTQKYEAAIEVMRPVLDQDGSDERARLTVVQALLAMQRDEEAIAELSMIQNLSADPDRVSIILSKLYLRLDDNERAAASLQAILDSRDNAQARYMLGAIYFEEQKFQAALDTLAAITPDKEEFEEAVLLRSRILHRQDRVDEALALLAGYLEHNETRRPLFFSLASSMLQEQGRAAEALDTAARGAAVYPEEQRLLFDYGLRLEQSGRLDEAIAVMQRIIRLNPDHAEALNFVGYSWADSDRHLEQALEYIERAMEIKPGNGYILDSLGWVHFKLGKLEKALSELTRALELVPDDPNIHEHLGDVYLSLGRFEEALEAYRAAYQNYEKPEKKEAVGNKIEDLEKP